MSITGPDFSLLSAEQKMRVADYWAKRITLFQFESLIQRLRRYIFAAVIAANQMNISDMKSATIQFNQLFETDLYHAFRAVHVAYGVQLTSKYIRPVGALRQAGNELILALDMIGVDLTELSVTEP